MSQDIVKLYLQDILYSYSDGSSKIILVGRTIDSSKQRIYISVDGFDPYFYISSNKMNNLELSTFISKNPLLPSWISSTNFQEIKKKWYFRNQYQSVIKIIGTEPFKVPEIKNVFEQNNYDCYEYDIPFAHRFLIDTGIYCGYVYTLKLNESFKRNKNILQMNAKVEDLLATKEYENETNFLIACFDIETANEDDISFQQLQENKEYEIIAISVCFGYYTDTSKIEFSIQSFIQSETVNEKKLLMEFMTFIQNLDPDCLVTFNGDSFDIPYIEARLNLYNLKFEMNLLHLKLKLQQGIDRRYRIAGKSVVDLFPKTWYIHTKSGKKRLIDIAEYFFPEKDKILKLELPALPGTIFKQGNFYLLKQYVEQDVKITFELFHKLFSGELAIAKINGAPYSDVLLATQRVNGEFLLMRILYEKGIIIPSKPRKKQIANNKQKRRDHPHTGGQVISPKIPMAQNVVIADFVSMYPTLINSLNIGSETFIDESHYIENPRSSLAVLQDRVISQRIRIKKQLKSDTFLSENEKNSLQNQQKALKLVANSMYGATLYVQGRFFDIEVCNSITFMARNLMNQIFTYAKDFGQSKHLEIEVIYSDTDSVFIQLKSPNNPSFTNNDEQVEWIKPIQEELLRHLNSLVPQGMELSLEDIAKRIIFQKMKDSSVGDEIRKKAYAYYSLLYEKLVIKGFEAIRSDLAQVTKSAQEKLFFILLDDNDPVKNSVKYLKSIIKHISKTPESLLLEEVLYSGIIRRAPSKYKSITPAIGAFLDYCKVNNLESEIYYFEFPRFPYAIVRGKRNEPLFKKAKHPSIIKRFHLKIDRNFYIHEIINIAERFDLPNPLDKQKSLFDFI